MEALTPKVIVPGDEVFVGQIGLDEVMSVTSLDGTSALIKRGRETTALPLLLSVL